LLDDPGLDMEELADTLRIAWAVEASSFEFVPGYDMGAASYGVGTAEGRFFLKIRFEPSPTVPLEVPRALLDAGVSNVLAPIRTMASGLWHVAGDRTLVLYPFVAGRNAMAVGMTSDQWRTFGATLRAVHDGRLAERFAERLPAESYALPARALVRHGLEQARRRSWPSPAATRLATLLRAESVRIRSMIERAEILGGRLRERSLPRVLCHADCHAANILVADDGRILLVDWDGPLLAPRERDLLFVMGSRIARTVEPHEEAWFFEGYGDVAVDREAIVYFRYERVLEDIGEIARSVFGDDARSQASREWEVSLADGFFQPGGMLDAIACI
jgi:spectinomycin phosphotransferase